MIFATTIVLSACNLNKNSLKYEVVSNAGVYEINSEFDASQLKLSITNNDGTKREVYVTPDMIKDMPDMTTLGEKTICQLIKFELIRLYRNKLVFFLLLGFCLLMFFLVAGIHSGHPGMKIGVYTDGIAIEEIEALDVVKQHADNAEIIVIESKEDGIYKVKSNEISLYLEVDNAEEPTNYHVYFNQSDVKVEVLKNVLLGENSKASYQAITEFLQSYGITINEDYFNVLAFHCVPEQGIESQQINFSQMLGTCLSVILILGLIYMISRDNEMSINKNLAVYPIKVDVFMWSRIIPFAILGLIEVVLLLFLGWLLLGVNYVLNPILIVLVCMLFVLSIICLGLICSMVKSQMGATLIGLITIMAPLMAYSTAFIGDYYFMVQIILYLFPLTHFYDLINAMTFNGVIIWSKALIVLVQGICYYFIARMLLTKSFKK